MSRNPHTAHTGKEHQTMTVIPISNLSQDEINMLGTNIVSAARHNREIDAVNRSLAFHDEQVEQTAGNYAAAS
jgi:hypothetical protein